MKREIIEAKKLQKRQTPGIIQANDNRPRTAAKSFDDHNSSQFGKKFLLSLC